MSDVDLGAERERLAAAADPSNRWRRWGPYLSERQWGTVREDYSADGQPWDYFPHDHARSRAYRWGEDGLLGISDDEQRLCFALALWNGADPILKERLFGLGGTEGNHGEDVKELYYYLDATPTNSYLRALYKYPQRAFPYADLVAENRRRTKDDPEYDLLDTGILADDRYFDVEIEYAKAEPEDIAIRIRVHNRGPETATLHLLPTLWFRNTWAWGRHHSRPTIRGIERTGERDRRAGALDGLVVAEQAHLGRFELLRRGIARAPLHRQRDECGAALRHAQPDDLRQGWDRGGPHRGSPRCGEPRAGGDQGRRPLRDRPRRGTGAGDQAPPPGG